MSGTDIVPAAATDSWVAIVQPAAQLAREISPTDFVPAAYRGKPAAVLSAVLTGREMGLGPFQSLRAINVIEGKPSLSAEALGALILRAGHHVEWGECTEKSASVRIRRRDGLAEADVTWTMRDAERAGLSRKKAWMQYPRDMLRNRAISEAARMACPDIALGLETAYGAPDAPVNGPEGAVVVQVRSAPESAQSAPEAPSTAIPVEREEPEEPPGASPDDSGTAEEPPAGDEPVTMSQATRLHAIVSEMERIAGKRLSRDERRTLIADHAGLGREIGTLKELTATQAGWAIASLTRLRDEMLREREESGDVVQS